MSALTDRAAIAIADRVLHTIRRGAVTVTWPDGSSGTFRGRRPGPHAQVVVTDLRLVRALATTGAIALADGWIAGWYDTPDLAAVIELAALQLEDSRPAPSALERAGRRLWASVTDPVAARGPLVDIVQHYDLGNDFYAAWLDPTMTYSSAYFERDDMTLEEAQRAKYRRLAARAGIEPGMRVLEIGSGWGANAVYLAGELGCEVTTVTVSREQARYVGKLAADQGLAGVIDVQLGDFAEATGTYDRVVSVEMIESIPRERWLDLLRVMRDRLAPDGTIGLQSIWVADRHWARSDANPDFVRRYIFPGGQVPAPMVLRDLASLAGLTWIGDESFGASYARTLHVWGERFDAAWPDIAALGFDERFRRMWRYYLAYCEGGFRSGRVGVSQIALRRL
jgi:cyclopropane-fatty-acyl-phospholipid synthase